MMDYRWSLSPLPDNFSEQVVSHLSQELNNLPPALARALVVRGIGTYDQAKTFFRGDEEILHDPFEMRDMEKAADRLARAIRSKERVLVYGDYDVDGTTAAAMTTRFLRNNGVEASFFIPHRFENGYGLCEEGLDEAVRQGASLVVALDCGITAVEEAQYAASKGLDLIIADHHEPGPTLPDAYAVLDPKRTDCPYPFKGLSGCGVGWKLIQATLQKLDRPVEDAEEFLDLLAISIAADIVPILGENRVLMKKGLQRLATNPSTGIRALASVAQVDLPRCDGTNIVFAFAPRINAAGRMDSARVAVDLFLEDDREQAQLYAQRLEQLNQMRRETDRKTFMQAEAHVAKYIQDDPAVLVLHQPDWHLGVLGIVAARIAERFHRPTVVLGGNEIGRGSARTVNGISIFQAIASCNEKLLAFGGHDAAAGLSIREEHIDHFRKSLDQAVRNQTLPEDRQPEILIDAELEDLTLLNDDIRSRFWNVLNQFEPFGPDNPRPVFKSSDLQIDRSPKRIGKDESHLRLSVRCSKSSRNFPVIGFGLGHKADALLAAARSGAPLELAFSITENHWNGRSSLQLEAKDVRVLKGRG